MTTELNNAPDFASIGRMAVNDWQSADKSNGKGDARAIYALFLAYQTATFTAVIQTKGEPDETFSFDLREYIETEPKANANGTRNIKAVAARTNAVAEKVFGIAKPDNAFKQRMQRAIKVVAFFVREGFDESNVSLNKRGELVVPYVAMHDEPKEEAGEKALKQYRAMEGETINLDGKDGDSIAELTRRATPKKERTANATGDTSKGAAFVASVVMVKNTMRAIMAVDGDDAKADGVPSPNEAVRKEMYDLLSVLTSYFQADPLSDKKADKNKAA
jgi:hypothetical protein